MPPEILILGGTGEARLLAERLAADSRSSPLSSLAGVTAQPRAIPGAVRTGGFGGAAGLAAFLRERSPAAVVDATHPFAVRISANAVDACRATLMPLVRLERPAWTMGPEDRWTEVADAAGAVNALRAFGRRVLLTVGRKELEPFVALGDRHFVVRSIDQPERMSFASFELILARGPFTRADEEGLLRRHRIDVMVARNSGGDDAKLAAARTLRLPVVMIRRPALPPAATVASVEAALAWLAAQPGRSR